MNLIEAVDVSRRFGVTLAVDQISLTLHPGEIVGLLGANGAGKTTLMRMLLGLLEPSSGRILTMGRPVGLAKKEVGYVPQGLGLYRDLTVAENLQFIAAAFGVEPPRLTASLSEVADRRVGEISLGLKRRTAFAAALSHDPSLLILDEPTSGVGPLGRAELWETIHESADDGTGVLISTHYMEETEECDRVIVLAQGHQVVAGPVADIVGSRKSVAVNGAQPEAIDQLRTAGMTVLADRAGWRVVNGDLTRVKDIVGGGAEVQSVPATFEEAFVAMSK